MPTRAKTGSTAPGARRLRAWVLGVLGGIAAIIVVATSLLVPPSPLESPEGGAFERGMRERMPPRVARATGDALMVSAAAPHDPEGPAAVGAILHGNAELALAVDAYDEALARGATDPRVSYLLGVAQLGRGRADLAVGPLQTAAAAAPDYVPAHVRLGAALRDVGRFDDACIAYRAALGHRPDVLEALVGMGAAHRQAGRLEDAKAFLERALAVDAESAAAHQLLGLTLAALGETEAAEVHLRRGGDARRIGGGGVMNDPWFAEVQAQAIVESTMLDLAEQYVASGHIDSALAQLDRIEAMHGKSAKVERVRGWAFAQARRPREAVNAYVRATDLDPANADAHAALAALLLDFGDPADAAHEAELALGHDPTHPQALLVRGSLAVRAGAFDEAVTILGPLVRDRPELFLGQLRLGEALSELERLDEAVAALSASVRLQPDHGPSHRLRGMVLARLGQSDEARRELQEALRIDEDDEDARRELERLGGGRP